MGALQPVAAQAPADTHTVSMQGVPLDEALERFATATGIALSYTPDLVDGHDVYCVEEDAPVESALACLLDGSGLTYHRLASGTYVLTEVPEHEVAYGHLVGTVSDKKADVPLVQAHVWVPELGRGTATNRSGHFALSDLLPGTYTVYISHVGYGTYRDTVQVASEERTRVAAELEHEPTRITPLIVEGLQRPATRTSASDASATHVDAEEPPIGYAAAEPDAFLALDALSGVRVNNVTSDLHVQGGAPGSTLLRLDGVPVHLPRSTTFGYIGPFNPLAIDRITVRQPGFDAQHGGATAGVIEATHRQPDERGVEAQADPLSLKATVHGTHTFGEDRTLTAMTTARVGLWDVHAPSALDQRLQSWSTPDLFPFRTVSSVEVPLRDDSAIRPDQQLTDIHTSARLHLSPLRTLHVSGYHGQRGLSGQHDALGPDSAPDPPLITLNDAYTWTNTLGQASYHAVVGNRTLLTTQARASRYVLRHQYDVLAADSTLDRGFTQVGLSDGNSVHTAALEADVEHARGNFHLQLGAEAEWMQSEFGLYGLRFSRPTSTDIPNFVSISFGASDAPQRVAHRNESVQATVFASTTWSPTATLDLTGGTRLTYRPQSGTVYAEPRLTLHLAPSERPWSMQTALALHRQFTYQTDASVLNTGALQSSTRIWLPLDATVRPPKTAHLTQEWVIRPHDRWTFRAEGYGALQMHDLAVRYATPGDESTAERVSQQHDFLAPAQGYRYGGTVAAEWRSSQLQTQLRYTHAQAMTQSNVRFDRRWTSAPDREPHRVEAGLDWHLNTHLTASLRGHGVWGRTWGFRQAYYDYFGASADAPTQGAFDLSQPDAHRLPPLYQLDLSIAYTRSVRNAMLQARLDLHNATGRANVAEWRLIQDENDNWIRDPYHLPGHFPSIALQVRL